MTYVRTCAVCRATLWHDEDPPSREDVERFKTHERSHGEALPSLELDAGGGGTGGSWLLACGAADTGVIG